MNEILKRTFDGKRPKGVRASRFHLDQVFHLSFNPASEGEKVEEKEKYDIACRAYFGNMP